MLGETNNQLSMALSMSVWCYMVSQMRSYLHENNMGIVILHIAQSMCPILHCLVTNTDKKTTTWLPLGALKAKKTHQF